MELNNKEIVFLKNLLANIDGHLMRHVLKNCEEVKKFDIDDISMKLYLKLCENETNNENTKRTKRTKEEMQARLDKMIEARHTLLERMAENDVLEAHRDYLICRILQLQTQEQYTRDDLLKKATMELEDIYEIIE